MPQKHHGAKDQTRKEKEEAQGRVLIFYPTNTFLIYYSEESYDSGSDGDTAYQPPKRYHSPLFHFCFPFYPHFTFYYYYYSPPLSTNTLRSVLTPAGPKGVAFVRSAATPSTSSAPSSSPAPSAPAALEEKKARKKLSSGYFSDEDNLSD